MCVECYDASLILRDVGGSGHRSFQGVFDNLPSILSHITNSAQQHNGSLVFPTGFTHGTADDERKHTQIIKKTSAAIDRPMRIIEHI